MRYIGTILLFSILVTNSFGQSKGNTATPSLPIDSITGRIIYTDVVYVDSSTTKEELFSRAREWFAKAYKSSLDVIQMEDQTNGKIIGKAAISVYSLTKFPDGHINYTISLYFKNGRYKYELTDFYHKGQYRSNYTIPDYGACEKMINTTDRTMGISHQKTYNSYLNKMNSEISVLVESLKMSMKVGTVNAKKDDW